jgi:alkylation response protein AidB-like acyl-CoA dehydrogenase
MAAAPFDAGGTGPKGFRAQVRRFVERELAPRALRWEREGRYPRRALAACGRRGYLGLDRAKTAILAEELARCESLGVALAIFVQAGLIAPLLDRLGTAAQKRRFLDPVRAGRRSGAFAVTEPAAGSDLASLAARAVPHRDGFLVDGEKTYITAAAAADFLVVAVRAGEPPAADLTLLLVPAGAPGVTVEPLATLGLGTTAMGRVTLRRCRVGRASVLGEAGAGYEYVQAALERERLYGGIAAVAWAEHACEKTRAHLRTRRAFGSALGRFQAIRHQMAEVATGLEAARQLNYATFARWAAGEEVTKEVAMIKLFSYRVAQRAIEVCLQLHGGAGYMADHWASRWYRDARALTIAAGTPEVMRELIAAHLRL